MPNLNYHQTLEYLFGLQRMGIKLGLENITRVLAAIGNPHHRLRAIHVGGSNGKGSTAAHLEAILLKAGLKVGLYTSPHLVRFTERITVNREEISEEEVVEWTRRILSKCPELGRDGSSSKLPITFFEFTTAIAFGYFAERDVDVAILEVGMGGRLDATNVCNPMVSVITSISLEHQDYLGRTLAEIAREKAGIIKPSVPVVSGVVHPVAQGIVRDVCIQKGAPLYRLGREMKTQGTPSRFYYQGIKASHKDLKTSMRGRHQVRNAALAIAACEVISDQGLKVPEGAIKEGLLDVRWRGRQQYFPGPPQILLDGAHNPEAMRSLCVSLRRDYHYERLRILLGVMRDKDYSRMLKTIAPLANEMVLCKPKMDRAEDPLVLQSKAFDLGIRATVVDSVAQGFEDLLARARPHDLVCATGSLFVVGEVLSYMEEKGLHLD